mgnify:CR=1 FL=1
MEIRQLLKYASISAVVLLGTACGGGGSGSTSSTSNGTSKVGTVSGFGSVFINGVEYETSNATITIDGQSAAESDLAVGMVVTVTGTDNGSTGNASSISNDDEVEGIVISNSIDPTTQTGTINVMGQTVTVRKTTMFESKVAGVNAPSQIAAGNIVEINGYSDGNGNIFATRIEVKAADLATYLITHPNGVEVKGLVGTIDTNNMQFQLGGITVDYTNAILDLNGNLTSGLFVEVKSVAGINNNGHLVASKVELENDGVMGHRGNDDDDDFEIKGIVTTAYANGRFAVDGTTVLVTNNTEFDDITTAQLVVGVMVEVEGDFNSNGELVADEVEREDDADTEVKGLIQTINATGTNSGTITLQDGTVIVVTNETLMKDEQDEGVTPVKMFNLTHLATGDFIEVDGVVDNATGDIIALKLERDDVKP